MSIVHALQARSCSLANQIGTRPDAFVSGPERGLRPEQVSSTATLDVDRYRLNYCGPLLAGRPAPRPLAGVGHDPLGPVDDRERSALG
jgi:hypothetical protein